jgi:hypothetical protein
VSTADDWAATHAPLGSEIEMTRQRLAQLREQLLAEASAAPTPAVARALEMADIYLFLALGYLGHVDELMPFASR